MNVGIIRQRDRITFIIHRFKIQDIYKENNFAGKWGDKPDERQPEQDHGQGGEVAGLGGASRSASNRCWTISGRQVLTCWIVILFSWPLESECKVEKKILAGKPEAEAGPGWGAGGDHPYHRDYFCCLEENIIWIMKPTCAEQKCVDEVSLKRTGNLREPLWINLLNCITSFKPFMEGV